MVKKLNENFKSLYSSLSTNSTSLNISSTTYVDTKIKSATERLNKEITDAVERLNTIIAEAEDSLDRKLESLDLSPPVGTYISCDYDPNLQWQGTKWIKIEETENDDVPRWKRVE